MRTLLSWSTDFKVIERDGKIDRQIERERESEKGRDWDVGMQSLINQK